MSELVTNRFMGAEALSSGSDERRIDRRSFLLTMAGAAGALGLTAVAGPTAVANAAVSLSSSQRSSKPLPKTVPSGTSLSIASSLEQIQTMFDLSGLVNDFKFKVSSWPNLGAGPDVINAFRSGSLDVAFNAGIPPIQAHYQGDPAKIVFVSQTRRPSYVFATKPHSTIKSVADFQGKKLGFSQGQAQGVVLLRALNQAKISFKDVDLVQLTSDQFLTALEAGQVDIAPLGISQVPLYLDKYGSEGAHTITTKVVDFLTIMWAPTSVLQNEAKVAAIAQLIPLYAKAKVWTWTHAANWEQNYYVKTQQITLPQAKQVVALTSKPWIPPSWDAAIAWEQETANLLSEGGYVKKFDVAQLFDRRFEHLAAPAVPATYRS